MARSARAVVAENLFLDYADAGLAVVSVNRNIWVSQTSGILYASAACLTHRLRFCVSLKADMAFFCRQHSQ